MNEIRILSGVDEFTTRQALRGIFEDFGEVELCYLPPTNRRGDEPGCIRFADSDAARKALTACRAGKVRLKSALVRAEYAVEAQDEPPEGRSSPPLPSRRSQISPPPKEKQRPLRPVAAVNGYKDNSTEPQERGALGRRRNGRFPDTGRSRSFSLPYDGPGKGRVQQQSRSRSRQVLSWRRERPDRSLDDAPRLGRRIGKGMSRSRSLRRARSCSRSVSRGRKGKGRWRSYDRERPNGERFREGKGAGKRRSPPRPEDSRRRPQSTDSREDPELEDFIVINRLDRRCAENLRELTPSQQASVIHEGFHVLKPGEKGNCSALVSSRITRVRKGQGKGKSKGKQDHSPRRSAGSEDESAEKKADEDVAIWDPYGDEDGEGKGGDSSDLLLEISNLPKGKNGTAEELMKTLTPTLQMLVSYQPQDGKAVLQAWCEGEAPNNKCLMRLQSETLTRAAVPILDNLSTSGVRLKVVLKGEEKSDA